MAYFSERDGDMPAQTQDAPKPAFIEAVVHFLAGYCSAAWLARRWPMKCPDPGGAIYATDEAAFWREGLTILNFEAKNPSELINESNPVRVLNLLEFAGRHIAKPLPGSVHSHYTHTHLLFLLKATGRC